MSTALRSGRSPATGLRSRLVAVLRGWPVLLLLALGFGVGLVAGYLAWHTSLSATPAAPTSDVPPGEYLYLDSGRVAAYLSQLEDGLSSNELRTLSETRGVSVGTGTTLPFQAQGTAQTQSSLQETVTPTAASLFYRLERKLRGQHWLQTLNAGPGRRGQFRALIRLREGNFVRIRNIPIALPAYARVYPAFARRAPALPLSVSVRLEGKKTDLLFPIAYGKLANEPSLFSTRLTVLGKVVRQLDPGERYVDYATAHSFARLLAAKPAAVRAHHLSARALERQFLRAVTVRGPGAVVLPVAIFK